MKQIVISKYGAPEVLQVRTTETPTPKSDEILIKNHFSGVNFSEVHGKELPSSITNQRPEAKGHSWFATGTDGASS